MSRQVPMTIKGLMLDPISNSPIVVLKDSEDKIFLPIWVGIFEANAIALKLENIDTPRPMTHDLLQSIISDAGQHVSRIVITELKDSTFYANIHLTGPAGDRIIDSRPSDAIALALRSSAPIYVEEGVLDAAQTISMDETQEDRLKKWLENASADELGKYKM